MNSKDKQKTLIPEDQMDLKNAPNNNTILFNGNKYYVEDLPPRLRELFSKYPIDKNENTSETLADILSQYTNAYTDHSDLAHTTVRNVVWKRLSGYKNSEMLPTSEPVVCDSDNVI